MSDVEKITFENHRRRREDDAHSAWERRAAENAKYQEKQRLVKSWLHFLTYVAFFGAGAAVAMSAVFAAMGDYGNLSTCVSAAFISICGGLILADKVER